MVREVEQAVDGDGLDVGGEVGQALGADAADAFEGQGELGVVGGTLEGFEGDLVGAAEVEFGHAWFVPVVEEGVDEVEGDLLIGGRRVHGGKVRRRPWGSRGIGRMYTKLRTDAVYAREKVALSASEGMIFAIPKDKPQSTQRAQRGGEGMGLDVKIAKGGAHQVWSGRVSSQDWSWAAMWGMPIWV